MQRFCSVKSKLQANHLAAVLWSAIVPCAVPASVDGSGKGQCRFSERPGIGYTLGSLAALVAFFIGGLGIAPLSGKLASLGGKIAAAGGPTPEEASEMRSLAGKLVRAEYMDFIMFAISMLTVPTARYWVL